jgi:hypothetical protein
MAKTKVKKVTIVHDEQTIYLEPRPNCPDCGAANMELRLPGPRQDWDPFWGCPNYKKDDCRGSRNIGVDGRPERDDDLEDYQL